MPFVKVSPKEQAVKKRLRKKQLVGSIFGYFLVGLVSLGLLALIWYIVSAYWTLASWVVDEELKIPQGPDIGAKFILIAFTLAILGLLWRIGSKKNA